MNFNQSLDLLDRLSIQQRGKRLEPLEREILGVAWENGSYLEIEGFQEQTVKNKAVKLWKYLSQLLHTKVNKYNLRQVLAELDSELSIAPIVNIDRHRRSRFYGRLTELWQLQSWVESERRKLIFIHGMKGIGKTALVRKLAENLAPRLDRVVWISLEAAPSLIDVLAIIIKELDGGRNAKLSKNLQTAIDKTISYLRNNRCLLVFDNADLVLVQDESSTSDLARDYTQFFDRLNSVASDSYCLTISTEKCWMRTIDSLPETLRERQLELQGLDRQSCQDLIQTSELVGTIAEWDTLIDRYQGNPQYLTIVASTITDIFAGKIEKFLTANILVYQPIETLLAQQLDLLSNAEMSILLWLAIEREPIDLDRLQLVTSVSITGTNTVKILDKLVRKYLVEVQDHLFTLPELIMESVTARYQDLVDEGITAKKFNILHLYPIILSAKTVNTDQDRAGNKIDKLHQNLQCNLTSIISRLLFRGRSTPPHREILSAIMFPSLQQRSKLKQDLKARLCDILIQLDMSEHKYLHHPKTQPSSTDIIQPAKIPSYAVENITNLLNSIDLELTS
jgi:DNA-binding MarR family transcriptional regulator